jgi:hypothetical protein
MGPQASPLELGASPIRFAIRRLRAYPSRANRSTAAQQFHALKQHYEGRATAHRREEETEFSNQALEFCIAHVPGGDEAEKVYRRRSMLAKRKQIMEAWARFATKPSSQVISIESKQAA